MLSCPIHKDISSYEAKIVAGLTKRTLIFSVLACVVGVAIGIFLWFGIGVDPTEFPWLFLILGGTAGFWAMGYVRPLGLKFEHWASLWLRQHLINQKFYYCSTASLGHCPAPKVGFAKETHIGQKQASNKLNKPYEKLRKKKGIELWEVGE